MSDPSRPVVLVGLIQLRERCAFTWEEPERGGQRVAKVRSTHCPECVTELRKLAYLVVRDDTDPPAAED